MAKQNGLTRRGALAGIAGAAGALLSASVAQGETETTEKKVVNGRIKQSVSRWCYRGIELDDLCVAAKDMGLVGIDLLDLEEIPTVTKHGLICTLANGPGPIDKGWNTTRQHRKLIKKSEELIPKIAATGCKNMIVFSGNRRGMDDKKGIDNCAAGLKEILPLAKEHGITLFMELLNSKRNHKDYMCDHTRWGVELVEKLGSEHFKLLYDIYHMQVMEGDVIQTILDYHDHIGHYHTGGVPGRNEIDSRQELNYRRICEVIADINFEGYLAHEYVPKDDPLTSLREAVVLCDV